MLFHISSKANLFIFIITLFPFFVNLVSNEIDIYCKINYERRFDMEALAYLLYSLVFGFFIALIGGIVKGTSPKYLIQTLEETEADFIKICWNVFYSYLGIIFSILLMLFTFSIPFVLIPFVIGCYYFYLFVLSLVLVFRFYSNIEMREISKPLIFSLIVQIVNYIIPFAFIAIPFYLIRRKKQRELLKMFSEKEQERN